MPLFQEYGCGLGHMQSTGLSECCVQCFVFESAEIQQQPQTAHVLFFHSNRQCFSHVCTQILCIPFTRLFAQPDRIAAAAVSKMQSGVFVMFLGNISRPKGIVVGKRKRPVTEDSVISIAPAKDLQLKMVGGVILRIAFDIFRKNEARDRAGPW